ncbi:class I SAM-dependent methyltransferase [Micromonospora sp. LH3U1]|uniref:class I SAM-dependent methyltransferase n=1 Tax=Micromonospora sp. LH3U1 TaxID=3018339 RepID=UPI00234BA628|nr:class I SAM-dependent methyltransferase [Micromonospora sp. LH3U1]WCN81963.1 class I SAM-dependent methyltransferase [Micromonospora sp. LH3U1]
MPRATSYPSAEGPVLGLETMNRRRSPRPVQARTDEQLAAEWDQVAAGRDQLIAEGRDLSYHYILLPALLQLSTEWLKPNHRILDAGCGTGKFASELARDHPKSQITGVDPSASSIEIAQANRPVVDNVEFHCMSVEAYVAAKELQPFDLIIANMLLQNVSSLSSVLDACARVLSPTGAFVFAVPHPCFWPRYWKYEKAPWFRYNKETWIEAPFRTSLAPDTVVTTSHTHRPLQSYFEAFTLAGLVVEELIEPYPDQGVEGAYPIAWEFPRFLLGRCRPQRRETS